MSKEAFRIMRDVTILYTASYAFTTAIGPIILLGKGLDLAQLGLFGAIWSASIILLQVPTGAFADAHGRKKAMMIAFILQLFYLIGLLFAPSPLILMFVAVIGAAAGSMMTGPIGAYTIDMLLAHGKSDRMHELLASGTFWFNLVLGATALIGGYAATLSLDYPILLCMTFAVIGLFYSWLKLAGDDKKKQFLATERSIAATMSKAFQQSVNNSSLRMIFILSLLFGFAAFGLFNYWQPVMKDMAGWNTLHMGLFFALTCVVTLLGARFSPHLKPDWNSLAMMFFGLSLFLFLAGYTTIPLVIVAFILLFNLPAGIAGPMEATIINRNATSDIRATTESINVMFSAAGRVLLGVLIFFMGASQPRLFWLIGAAALLLGALVVLLKKPKETKAAISYLGKKK